VWPLWYAALAGMHVRQAGALQVWVSGPARTARIGNSDDLAVTRTLDIDAVGTARSG